MKLAPCAEPSMSFAVSRRSWQGVGLQWWAVYGRWQCKELAFPDENDPPGMLFL